MGDSFKVCLSISKTGEESNSAHTHPGRYVFAIVSLTHRPLAKQE